MFRRLGTLFACLAMFLIAGGHWAVLQGVAWAGMLGSYSQQGDLVTAVQKTFSGDYPCDMCRKIDTAQKKQEQQAPFAKSDKKFESFVAQEPAAWLSPPPPLFALRAPSFLIPPAFSVSPPRPVPRVA